MNCRIRHLSQGKWTWSLWLVTDSTSWFSIWTDGGAGPALTFWTFVFCQLQCRPMVLKVNKPEIIHGFVVSRVWSVTGKSGGQASFLDPVLPRSMNARSGKALSLAVSTQYTNVTDRRRKPRLCIASSSEKQIKEMWCEKSEQTNKQILHQISTFVFVLYSAVFGIEQICYFLLRKNWRKWLRAGLWLLTGCVRKFV